MKVFCAYPSRPAEIGQTIKSAKEELLRYHASVEASLWEQLEIPGRFIAEGVLEAIENADVTAADITVPNFNVTFEIGFAIGRGKRVITLQYAPLAPADRALRGQMGIFDTLAYKEYQNSKELTALLRDLREHPIRAISRAGNVRAPVYLTEDRWRTDGATRIIARIKKARLGYRSFDPNEQPRLSAVDAIAQVSQSYGVLVHLVSASRQDSSLTNIRGAFIAGLAQGMEKELLILQQGDDPVPLDFRDLVSSYTYPEQIDEYISDFAGRVYEAVQGSVEIPVTASQSILARMELGASSAENELRELGEYYLPTEGFRRAQRGDVRLILGRKGSGKTAIFLQVRDRLRSQQNVVLDLKPDGFRLIKFRDQVLSLLDRGTAEHTVTAFWEFLLFIELAHKVIDLDRERSRMDSRLVKPYRDLLETYRAYGYEQQGDFAERMSRLLGRIEGDMSARLAGSTEKTLPAQEITAIIHRKDLVELQRALLGYLPSKRSVWILFDNIDKGWASHGIAKEDLVVVKSLIEATRKVERALQQRDVEAHSLVFLRNDVYELLIDQLPDRGKEAKAILDWTDSELLREVLRRRAHHAGCETASTFADLWASVCVSHIDGEESSQYLVDRSLMRPRHLIDLVNYCRGNALTLGHERIEQDDLRAGTALLSRDLVSDLSHEIRDVHPSAEDLLYAFTGYDPNMSQDDVVLALMEAQIPESQHEQVTQLLIWYGFLGVLDDDNDPRFIYQVQYNPKVLATYRNRRTRQAKCFQVNPVFWPALGIKAH
jgi:hypothetical protein